MPSGVLSLLLGPLRPSCASSSSLRAEGLTKLSWNLRGEKVFCAVRMLPLSPQRGRRAVHNIGRLALGCDGNAQFTIPIRSLSPTEHMSRLAMNQARIFVIFPAAIAARSDLLHKPDHSANFFAYTKKLECAVSRVTELGGLGHTTRTGNEIPQSWQAANRTEVLRVCLHSSSPPPVGPVRTSAHKSSNAIPRVYNSALEWNFNRELGLYLSRGSNR